MQAAQKTIQKFVRPTGSPRQRRPGRIKNGDLSIVFFQLGRAKDLSAPLYRYDSLSFWYCSSGAEANLQVFYCGASPTATLYRGADKSLDRPGRKQATATKL